MGIISLKYTYYYIYKQKIIFMNVLEKIKKLVFNENAEIKLGEASLEDGTILSLSTDSPEIGTKVMIGEEVAPEGEYLLSDGSTITIDGTGTISAMDGVEEIPAEEVMEDIPAEAVAEVVVEAVEEVAEVVDALTPEDVTPEDAVIIAEEIVALIEEKVAIVEEAMNAQFEEFKNLMIELAEEQVKSDKEFKEFKKSPSGKTISQTEFSVEETKNNLMQTRKANIKALREQNN